MMKRLFDLSLSSAGLLVLAPVLLLLMPLVRFKLGSPIFFTQIRPGLNGKHFRMVKFRTMTDACDDAGNLLPDAERLTSFGKFLRATSLDEVPELINVLKGRDEPGRTAPAPYGIPTALFARTGAPSRSAPWYYRLGAGEWP